MPWLDSHSLQGKEVGGWGSSHSRVRRWVGGDSLTAG